MNKIAKMALMLEGVLADRLIKNEMVPYWLKEEKKQSNILQYNSISSENKG